MIKRLFNRYSLAEELYLPMNQSAKSLQLSLIFLALASCAGAPDVSISRQMLWQEFGDKPLDNLLVAWGPPSAETHLTTGARMVTYVRTVVYNNGWYDESSYGCKASFLAPTPDFTIKNVSLDGNDEECAELAQGHIGTSIYPAPHVGAFFGALPPY
jgi:hypothetical protein